MSDFVFDLDPGALSDLADSDDVDGLLQDVGDQIADRAFARAPKRTGKGAGSIQAVVSDDGDGKHVDVSWGAAYFYMGFAETGTEHQAATPFLRPALDETKL